MDNTLEFEIPEGYEIDKEQSTNKKVVYKKVEKYEPKEGDLVVFTLTDIEEKEYIGIWKCDPAITPCLFRSIITSYRWSYMPDSHNVKGHIIRRATVDETVLFTDILEKNGYKYDPHKKEVRKRWRAKYGEQYFYVSSHLIVCMTADSYCLQPNVHYNIGNYFRTREEAEAVATEFREILNKRQ